MVTMCHEQGAAGAAARQRESAVVVDGAHPVQSSWRLRRGTPLVSGVPVVGPERSGRYGTARLVGPGGWKRVERVRGIDRTPRHEPRASRVFEGACRECRSFREPLTVGLYYRRSRVIWRGKKLPFTHTSIAAAPVIRTLPEVRPNPSRAAGI